MEASGRIRKHLEETAETAESGSKGIVEFREKRGGIQFVQNSLDTVNGCRPGGKNQASLLTEKTWARQGGTSKYNPVVFKLGPSRS
jgi:hypothetical protein